MNDQMLALIAALALFALVLVLIVRRRIRPKEPPGPEPQTAPKNTPPATQALSADPFLARLATQARKDRTAGSVTVDPTLYDITYISEWGEVTERRIRVERTYSSSGAFYVRAHCFLRDDDRTFRVDRIESATNVRSGRVVDPRRHFTGARGGA